MAKYIKKKELKEAIYQLLWYSVNQNGKLVKGAEREEDAYVKYSDLKAIVKGLKQIERSEQMWSDENSCPNCYYEYFDDRAFPCSRCIHNEPSEDMFRPKSRADRATARRIY